VTRDAAPEEGEGESEGRSVYDPALDVTVTLLPTSKGKGDAKP
jgi:hypothetical protein